MGKKGYFIISSHQMPTEDSHWSDPTGGFHGKGSVTPHPLACQLERDVRHKLWCLVESHLTASPLGRFQQSSKLHKSIRPGLHWWGGGEGDWSKLCNFSYVTNLLLTYRGVFTTVSRLLPLPSTLPAPLIELEYRSQQESARGSIYHVLTRCDKLIPIGLD